MYVFSSFGLVHVIINVFSSFGLVHVIMGVFAVVFVEL